MDQPSLQAVDWRGQLPKLDYDTSPMVAKCVQVSPEIRSARTTGDSASWPWCGGDMREAFAALQVFRDGDMILWPASSVSNRAFEE